MRKRFVILSIFIFLLSLSLVSAVDPVSGVGDLLNEAKRLVVIFINFATDILFNVNQIEDFLFAKILVSLLIFMIVYTVLKRNNILTHDNKIHIVIALAVTFLAVRFIPDSEFMNAILLPYGVLGISLTVLLPFIIYFFFVHQSNIGPFGRRVAWVLFGIIFLVIWAMRRAELSDIGEYIYWAGIGFVLISLIFDKSIHRYFGYADFRRIARTGRERRKRQILRDIHQLNQDRDNKVINEDQYQRELKELDRQYKKG